MLYFNMYLTKSDFLASKKCSTKLFYLKNNYPAKEADELFMQQLAEAGYHTKELAKLNFKGGVQIDNTQLETALALTDNLLEEDNVTIFDAVFRSGKKLATIDVLVKRGNDVHLYEVTSSVYKNR